MPAASEVAATTISEQSASTSAASPVQRNVAVDAYRGLVMLLMMAEVLRLSEVARSFPGNPIWRFLAFNQSHVEWAGMSLHDTIQPGFTFLAGVALPYSIRSRQRKGESFPRMLLHTIWRSVLLIALGIFLRSTAGPITYFTFEDTLTQIGLGYWLAWALYPAPGAGFNYAAVGVPSDWPGHLYSGFASHWNKNSNLGQAVDVWFLNLFPRTVPFAFNGGGYLTLSFIPTLGTMLIGIIAGRWFHEAAPRIPLRRFLLAAVSLIAIGLVCHFTGICPIVKRIWTPSWTLFSGGVCLLFLTAFCWIVDVKNNRRLAFPLVVIGMNSIAAYMMAHLWEEFIQNSFKIHLGMNLLDAFSATLEPLVMGSLTLLAYWLILYWMFKNKVFIRI